MDRQCFGLNIPIGIDWAEITEYFYNHLDTWEVKNGFRFSRDTKTECGSLKTMGEQTSVFENMEFHMWSFDLIYKKKCNGLSQIFEL